MEKKKLFTNQKYFYFLTELFVGIALMGIEMCASRLISVYFSSSQIIWTIIIGVIMIAMAIGNYWGGRQADKKPSYLRLYFELLFAGMWIVLIPFFGRFIIGGIAVLFAMFVKSGLVIYSAIFSCFILFVPPLLFVGKVTPSLIKYSLEEKVSGKVIGLLKALNTIGSIVGTFLPTFLTIPFIGTSNSFVLFGSMVAGLGLIYIVIHYIDYFKNQQKTKKIKEIKTVKTKGKEKKRDYNLKTCILSGVFSFLWICGIVLSSNASPIFWEDKTTLVEADSMYNYLKVDKTGKTTYFSTNVLFGIQSCMNDDFSLTGMYYDKLLVGPYLVKENPDILVLGNGTGTFATMVKEYLKIDCNITAVEIDQKIIDLSYEYFQMNKDVNVVCDDGLLMMNINMSSDNVDSIDKALCDTAYGVFDNLYACSSNGGKEVFAFKNKDVDLIQKIGELSMDNLSLFNVFTNLRRNLAKYEDTGIRLYDDTADVEMRSMKTLDKIVQNELEYYREIYRAKGLKGLLEILFN